MGDLTIGGVKLEIGGDIKSLQAAVRDGKVSVEDLGRFLETRLDKASTSAERSVNNLVKSLTGVKPTSQLDQLAVALEKIGGVEKLTSIQTENLANKIKMLQAAGGTVPASLQGVIASVGNLNSALGKAGSAIEGQMGAGLQGLAGQLGPLGGVLAAIGPAGLTAAAGIGAVAVAGAGVAKVLLDSADAAMTYADHFADLNVATDIGTDALQDFAFSAALGSGSVETITAALFKMEKAMAKSPTLFTDLGLSMSQLRSMKPEEQLIAVGDAIEQISNKVDRDNAALEIFGRKWGDVRVVLQGLRDGAGESLDAIGAKIDSEMIVKLSALDDKTKTLHAAWDGLWRNVGASVATMPGVAKGIDDITAAIGRLSKNVQTQGPGAILDPFLNAITFGGFGAGLENMANPQGASAADIERIRLANETARMQATPGYGVVKPKLASTAPSVRNSPTYRSAADRKDETDAARVQNEVDEQSIRITQELAVAQASLGVGLDAEIAKINANTAAKIASNNNDSKYNKQQKAELNEGAKALGDMQIAVAKEAAERKLAAVATAMYSDAQKIANAAIEAGMTPLERKLGAIEATRVAQVDETNSLYLRTKAEQGDSEALDRAYSAKIKAINASAAGAKAAAEEADELSKLANATDTAAAANKARDTMSKLFIESEKHRVEELVATWENLGDVLGGLGDLFEALGGRADSTIGGMLSSANQATDIIARTQKQGYLSFGDMLGGASSIAKSKNPLAGALEGGMVGAQFGPQGAVIGAGIGALLGFAGKAVKTESQKIAADVGRDFGVTISDELAKSIEKSGKGRFDGALMHLREIMDTAGGVGKFGAGKAADALHDVFSAVDRGTMSLEEASSVFDETFGDIAAANISKTTGIATDKLRELVNVAKDFGIQSEPLREFLKGQASASIGGIGAGLAAMKTTREKAADDAARVAERQARNRALEQGMSQEDADRIGREAGAKAGRNSTAGKLVNQGAATGISAGLAGDFGQLVAGGMSAVDAAKQIAPAVAAMREELKAAGLEGSSAFNELAGIIDIVTGEVSGPLVEGIAGFTTGMVGLYNTGQLTSEMFTGMTAQIGANIDALAAQGIEGPAAIAVMQPQLQAIWELHQKTGFAIDESTQKLIDQAVEAGAVGEAHKSAAERTADSMGLVVDVLKLVAEQLGVTKEKLDALGDKTVNVDVNVRQHGELPGGADVSGSGGSDSMNSDTGGDVPQYAMGTGGIVNFGSETIAALHGWEGVYTASQIDAMQSSTFAAGASAGMQWGAQRGVDLAPVVGAIAGLNSKLDRLGTRIVDGTRDAVLAMPQR